MEEKYVLIILDRFTPGSIAIMVRDMVYHELLSLMGQYGVIPSSTTPYQLRTMLAGVISSYTIADTMNAHFVIRITAGTDNTVSMPSDRMDRVGVIRLAGHGLVGTGDPSKGELIIPHSADFGILLDQWLSSAYVAKYLTRIPAPQPEENAAADVLDVLPAETIDTITKTVPEYLEKIHISLRRLLYRNR